LLIYLEGTTQATMGRVRATIVAVEKQWVLYIIVWVWVCVCPLVSSMQCACAILLSVTCPAL